MAETAELLAPFRGELALEAAPLRLKHRCARSTVTPRRSRPGICQLSLCQLSIPRASSAYGMGR